MQPIRRLRHATTVCTLSPLALAIHLALTVGATALPGIATATSGTPDTAAKSVTLGAGPLGRTLAGFATAQGVLLSFDPALTEGKSSNGLQGNYNAQQGFDQLLLNSGLEVVRQANGSFLLRVQAAPQAAISTLSAISVTAALDAATEGSGAYNSNTVTLGKSAQALRDVPQTVSVLTRQRLDDQNINDLTGALEQTAGITTSQTGFFDAGFYARGFQITNLQIDGGAPMTMALAGFQTQQDFAQYDHVEVLRGANGLFGAAGEPGGAVNLVRKRPLAQRQVLFNTSAGSWQNYRTELDVTGPLSADGAVRGRVVASYTDRHFFYDVATQRRGLLYGIVEVDLTPDTLLAGGFSLNRMSGKPWFLGLPRYSNGADIGLPRHTSFAVNWGRIEVDSNEVFAKLEHTFTPDWQVKVNLTRNVQTSDRKYARTTAVDPITNMSTVSGLTVRFEPKQTVADISVSGKFDLFGRRHDVLVGADRQQTTSSFSNLQSASLPFNVFNFDPNGYAEPNGALTVQNSAWGQKQRGLYGRLTLRWAEPWQLIVGARRASYAFEQLNAAGTGTRYRESAIVTPYAGLVYDIDKQWSAYGSVAETYKSQASSLQGPLPGTPLDAITGRNYELGVKGALWNGSVNTAVALYRIERNGQAVRDANYASTPGLDGSSCCFVALGEVVSQGVDAEISGEIAPRWQASAGYTYNNNKNKQAGSVPYSAITPKHLFKLWSNYQLPAAYGRWKLGGGVTVQSASYVSGTASSFNPATNLWNGPSVPFNFSQSGYATWNARLEYRINEQWSAALNLNNIFDKMYYQAGGNRDYYNWYGEPRNGLLTVRAKF